MKKKMNLLTRVALAATVFVTTLAGVAPMEVKADSYTVTYDSNGGSGTMNAASVDTGNDTSANYTLLANGFTAPSGQRFKGWLVGSETTEKEPGTSITVSENVTVKASWENIPTTSAALSRVEIKTAPRTTYTEGDTFDKTGVVLTAIYSDGSSKDVEDKDVTFSPTIALSRSNNAVTLTYNDGSNERSVNQPITVNAAPTITYTATAKPDSITAGSDSSIDITVTSSPASTATITALTGSGIDETDPEIDYDLLSNGKGAILKSSYVKRELSATTGEKTIYVHMSDGQTATVKIPVTSNYRVTPNVTTYDKGNSSRSMTFTVSDGTVDSVSLYSTNGNTAISGTTKSNNNKTITVPTSYMDSLQNTSYTFVVKNTDSATYKDQTIPISVTGTPDSSGESKELDSIKWASSSSSSLGDISTGEESTHNAIGSAQKTRIHLVNSTLNINHSTGLTLSDIKKEIEKLNKVDIKLKDVNTRTADVKWLYDYTQGSNDDSSTRVNNYSSSKTDKQSFVVYSEPIAYSDNNAYQVSGYNYFRLKLNVVVGENVANTTTGTGNVAAPTFNPPSGSYVYVGQTITMTSSTAGASFRSTSGETSVSTTSGTAGSAIKVPTTSGTWKLNAIAYTSTSAYSSVASATYTVVPANNYTIVEGNGQQVGTASGTSPQFTFSGDAGKLRALYIDDKLVPTTSYTVTSGSTVITLSPTYLATLTAGNHTIAAVYDDGSASGSFTLTADGTAASTVTNINPTTTTTTNSGRSYTGTDDKSNLVIMFVLLGMLIAGLSGAIYFKNEKVRRNRYMD